MHEVKNTNTKPDDFFSPIEESRHSLSPGTLAMNRKQMWKNDTLSLTNNGKKKVYFRIIGAF